MPEKKDKFQFPVKGFYSVANKVGEADYFLDQLKQKAGVANEFGYIFSAFVSAVRSITFSLQAVMSHYPGFDMWYKPRQDKLKKSKMGRYFVKLRNHIQKVGDIPIIHSGSMVDGEINWFQEFTPLKEIKECPSGNVLVLAEDYFKLILKIISECYNDFVPYINPSTLFTLSGLEKLGWSIEDLEESLGFPRKWTDIPYDGNDKEGQRLRVLRRYGSEEIMEVYFEKYRVTSNRK